MYQVAKLEKVDHTFFDAIKARVVMPYLSIDLLPFFCAELLLNSPVNNLRPPGNLRKVFIRREIEGGRIYRCGGSIPLFRCRRSRKRLQEKPYALIKHLEIAYSF